MPDLQRLGEMIRMAAYEEKKGNGHRDILRYYRSDYVALQMIRTAIYTTIAYGLILGLLVASNAEELLARVGRMDLPFVITVLVAVYLAMLGIWLFMTFGLSMHRYNKEAENLGAYKRHLGNLKEMLQ